MDKFDDMADMAVRFVRKTWESRRAEMIRWLIEEKKFSRDGAIKCADGFIASIVFAAAETAKGEAQTARNKERQKFKEPA